jgi:hypothetical protein
VLELDFSVESCWGGIFKGKSGGKDWKKDRIKTTIEDGW